MLSIRIFLQILFFIFLYSCKSNAYKDDRIKHFVFSECQENCYNLDGIVKEDYSNNKLRLSFGELMNCGTEKAYLESIRTIGDTLIVKLAIPYEIVDDDTVYAATDCDCYYTVDLEIANVNVRPQFLIIEKPLDEISIYGLDKNLRRKKVLALTDSIFSDKKIFVSISPTIKYLDSIQKTSDGKEIVHEFRRIQNSMANYLLKCGYEQYEIPKRGSLYFKLSNGQLQSIDTTYFANKLGNLIFNGKDSAFVHTEITHVDEFF